MFHYGGSTSIMQVPDTHIHQPFSSLYLECEQAQFTRKRLTHPGDVGRSLQQVIDDVVTCWRAMDHQKSVKGH